MDILFICLHDNIDLSLFLAPVSTCYRFDKYFKYFEEDKVERSHYRQKKYLESTFL